MNSVKLYISIILSCILVATIGTAILMGKNTVYSSSVSPEAMEIEGVELTAQYEEKENQRILVCTLHNETNEDITFGTRYYIEVQEDGSWYELVDQSGKRAEEKDWENIAYCLKPKREDQFQISLNRYRLEEGVNYRIVKYIHLGDTYEDGMKENLAVGMFRVME